MGGEELVDDLRQQLVGDQLGILVVADDDTGKALGPPVDVEGVRLLLDVLPRARGHALGHGAGEQGEELADGGALEVRKGVKGLDGHQLVGWFWVVADHLGFAIGVSSWSCEGKGWCTPM